MANRADCSVLERDGYITLKRVVSAVDCLRLIREIDEAARQAERDFISSSRRKIVGGRNLLSQWHGWRSLLQETILADLVLQTLGEQAGVVRALFFDKPPGEGWSLALHKDRTIAVKEHCQVCAPFAKPTRKAGVPHVEATEDLLHRMLTLRFHLDAMHDDNGPLIVVPGSHDDSQTESEIRTIHCDAGDVFVMRPLLSHGSRAANPTTTDHRRVLHLELAASEELPGEWQWHQFEKIGRVFD
ncbi:phytanoyl-CoA dioxygenase family protein [Planctomycetes bacterium K23_9]|uniref:Phytanoyl-CoA dioxygenase (PhyH) n=1 Tax=Stieleria marina TaxID=1930275 RepID=A0A517NN57_9BACT|nr:Phytanoyl-CoA dioxygenase (PhyH) [Planctomycetes bacterium K23_9]